jgi:hypothetical protein
MKRTLAATITVLSLAASGAASAQADIGPQATGARAGKIMGSQSSGVGAGKINFNPFSITRK